MNEQELDELMRSAGPSYRAGGPPPLDRMWSGVAARAFGGTVGPVRPVPVARTWFRPAALAATLVLGIGLGWVAARWSPMAPPAERQQRVAGPSELIPVDRREEPSPFVGLAGNYFQQTTGLVVALAGDLSSGKVESGTISRARDLLSTTRLLLDGQLPDGAVRDLLQDLELVLAQVVRLPANRQPHADTELIVEAMNQRDVLPRLAMIVSEREMAP